MVPSSDSEIRAITFDLEIAEPIDFDKGGWAAARRGECGVASVVLYDTETGRYHMYSGEQAPLPNGDPDPHGIEACMDHLNLADLLISFNGDGFDIPVLENYTGIELNVPSYDILTEVWESIGERHKGYGLGPICERTIGCGKSGSGESAPKLFKAGRMAELFDYNLNDVYLTRTLARFIEEHGYIIDIAGDTLELPKPGVLA